jgi:hypothetical protein
VGPKKFHEKKIVVFRSHNSRTSRVLFDKMKSEFLFNEQNLEPYSIALTAKSQLVSIKQQPTLGWKVLSQAVAQ